MPVIKANTSIGYTKEAVVLDLGDLGRQAARLRMAAEDKAGKIVSEAELKARQMIADAAQGGYDEGKAAGLEQGVLEGRELGRKEALEERRDQIEQLLTAWTDVANQWDGQTKNMAIEAREVIVEFALKMAERLVHRVIEIDPSVVVDQVAGALAMVLQPMDVSVRVHPAEVPIISEAMPQLIAEFDHLTHIHLTEDTQVSPGGCVVTYGQGQIDASIEKQIQRVVDLILPEDTVPEGDVGTMVDHPSDPAPPLNNGSGAEGGSPEPG